MGFYKNYSFEYTSKSVDTFKAIAVCSHAADADLYKEGCPIDIANANFYGVITESKNTGERLNIQITAESYSRELRNTTITETTEFRQYDAINIIKQYLLPDGWTFEYPGSFDLYPRYISYILRNGTYISHISTILQLLGLEFTIFTTKTGETYNKTIQAYFPDDFSDKTITPLEEYKQFGNLSISVDYGKIATSITVMGSDTEVGVSQSIMDAEMGDWLNTPHAYEIKDTQVKTPEISADASYLYYYPASPEDCSIGLITTGDIINIENEKIHVAAVNYLPEIRVSSFENGDITDADIATYLQDISNYESSGAVVITLSKDATAWFESVQREITVSDMRNIGAYGTKSEEHAIYDPILLSNIKITVSSYLTLGKNLPAENGFIWIGSERMFYRSAVAEGGNLYSLTGVVRGVPTCAFASCEHYGTSLGHSGWTVGCPYGGVDRNENIGNYCILAQSIVSNGIPLVHSDIITNNGTACPICFDNESPCPLFACKNIKNDEEFKALCPKGISRENIVWTDKYLHRKDTIVFPDSYYYNDGGSDVYEEYARDSLIVKYGYIPTTISVQGVADADTLDKSAAGYLRLSSLPLSGTITLFSFDPWMIPSWAYPGNAVSIRVASRGRYDLDDGAWYPTHWFDTASGATCPGDIDEWIEVGNGQWYKIKDMFMIQKTVKSQCNAPVIHFGTPGSDFQSVLEYVKDIKNTASQRHANETLSKTVQVSPNGTAAQVKDMKSGKMTWVRMVR